MKLHLLLCALLSCTLSSAAYNLRQISHRDGLSNSAILSIYQDDNGMMYFGSCDGLNIFDGAEVSIYGSNNDNYLSGNMIEKIVETENETLWLCTNYGLNCLNLLDKEVDYYSQFPSSTFLLTDKKKDIFLLTKEHSLYHFKTNEKSFKEVDNELFKEANDIILNAFIDGKDRLLLFYKSGKILTLSIRKQQETTLEFFSENTVSKNMLQCFIEDSVAYCITSDYDLLEYSATDQQIKYVLNLKKQLRQKNEISSIAKYKNDYFIGFKTNGLLCISPTLNEERYETKEIDIKAGIFCIYKDKFQDILWIGTDGQGVFQLYESPYILKSYLLNDIASNAKKPIRTLLLDKQNTLWIGTKGAGLLKISDFKYEQNLHDSQIATLNTKNSHLTNNSVYALSEGKNDILWIGHEDGIDYYSYRKKQINHLKIEYKGTPIKYIHGISQENDSILWLASVGMGIIRLSIKNTQLGPIVNDVKQILICNGHSSFNHFFTNYIDTLQNAVWYGNRSRGLHKVDTRTFEVKSFLLGNQENNQLLNDIFSIYKDNAGNLWCGTSHGLVKYSTDGSIKVFNDKAGFENNTVHGVLKGSGNNLWLSTNSGIIRFDMNTENFQIYSTYNGLTISEFSDGAYFKDSQTGNLLFGGINGFVSIEEKKNCEIHTYQPPILFNNLSIFGKEYNINKFCKQENGQNILTLKYNQNFFSLSFSVNDYINGNNYLFYYRLNELTDQWVYNKNNRSISFTNIVPGKYNLQVKYKNRVTGQESPIYCLVLNICPPWYASWGAYIIYAILFLSCVGLVIYTIIRKNKIKRLKLLEKARIQHQEELNESKLHFFTNIAYELYTPLTLIYVPCSRILSYKKADKFITDYVKIIKRNVEYLNDLIQELIEFRKIETGGRKACIENTSISNLMKDIAASIQENVRDTHLRLKFEYDIPNSLWWNTDKNFIYTITNNLLVNALKCTKDDGSLKMQIRINEENKLCIWVYTSGRGIKEENFSQIFDRYRILSFFEKEENTNNNYTAISLAISHNLVKLLNGTINVESDADKGTSFTVVLPDLPVSVHPDEKSNSHAVDIPTNHKYIPDIKLPEYKFDYNKQTIFVIDDDTDILWLICDIFKDDFNVVPFKHIDNPKDLLNNIYPDLIICNATLQHINPISLVRYFKDNKKLEHVFFIFLSEKDDMEEQMKGLNAGIDMYITKPFNVDFLKISVKRLITSREKLKKYLSSPLSAFDLIEGKLLHNVDKLFLQNILDIINNNIKNNHLSTSFVAKELGISTRQLYRKISTISEKNVIDMIRESRLHIAQQLLQETQKTIDEVMYESGFQNRTTFYKAFAEKYNCTPREFRDKITNKDI